MPVYALDKNIWFPNPNLADEEGLLAVGGDLNIDRLLLAYSNGIFPWYSEEDPILWWAPDPRMILLPNKFKVSSSLSQTVRNKKFSIKFDTNFEEVIQQCSKITRKDQDGTWITEDMKNAYIKLFNEGYAHSIETYRNDKLVGGLYGISLGRSFMGESMFHLERDASKFALFYLIQKLISWNFHFIDAQIETNHLKSLGATNISRQKYLSMLKEALKHPTIKGKW